MCGLVGYSAATAALLVGPSSSSVLPLQGSDNEMQITCERAVNAYIGTSHALPRTRIRLQTLRIHSEEVSWLTGGQENTDVLLTCR